MLPPGEKLSDPLLGDIPEDAESDLYRFGHKGATTALYCTGTFTTRDGAMSLHFVGVIG